MATAAETWVRGGPRDIGAPAPDYLDAALRPFRDELEDLKPQDVALIDTHTHLGLDIDGRSMDLPTLLAILDEAGVERACTFPLHDPDREPAYRVPNDRVLQWASESGGRLTPFCRLDPAETPREEGERALAKGAQGIKLHPRAQHSDNFDNPGIDAIFNLAEDAQVPLLIHMGRGMPPLAEDLLAVAHRHPGATLILAHAATHDMARITRGMEGHPGCFYDTAVFSGQDVMDLYARTPPERVVFGSDPPYGRPFAGLYLALRAARAVSLAPALTQGLAGRTVAGILRGDPHPIPTQPLAPRERTTTTTLARVYGVCAMVTGTAFTGSAAIGAEMLEMGIAACKDPDPVPGTGETLERLGSALTVVQRLFRSEETVWHGLGLMHLCLSLAATA